MATQVQRRKGTTTQHSTFTGASAELTVDTTKNTVVVHDGVTAGGTPLAKESGSALSPASLTLPNGTANGVTYLNGSKVLTSGSALTFDGAKLTLSATSGETQLLTATGSSNYLSIKGDTGGTTLWTGIGTDVGVSWLGSISNHPVSFRQNNSEQMRLTSTGLGIGTSSPAYKLQVVGGAVAASRARSNTAGDMALTISPSDSTIQYGFRVDSNTNNLNIDSFVGGSYLTRAILDTSGNLGLGVTPSAWSTAYKVIQIGSTASVFEGSGGQTFLGNNWYSNVSDSPTYLTTDHATYYRQLNGVHSWHTASSGTAGNAISFTQALTLTAAGELLVGATSNVSGTPKLYVKSNDSSMAARFYSTGISDGQHLVYFDKPSTTTSSNQVFIGFTINNQATGSGQINANGASQAAFGSFSDARLKQNIVDLPSQLSSIMALRPVEFDYISSEGGGHQISFIAQEFEEIYPDAVGERADGMKTLTGWGKTEARLVKAIQELKSEFDAYKAAHP